MVFFFFLLRLFIFCRAKLFDLALLREEKDTMFAIRIITSAVVILSVSYLSSGQATGEYFIPKG